MSDDGRSRFSRRPASRGRSPLRPIPLRPIETAAPRRDDLPLQARAIIGRERELAVARERLLLADLRLLTLTGPPGVGKTRIAVEFGWNALREFDDGVRFIDLAPIADARLVIEAIARGLGLHDVDRHVALEVVEEFLRERAVLLILDNFEQVLDAAEVVGRLLAACPRLKVLATSRAPLHLGWERELPIPPLDLPDLAAPPRAEQVAASAAGQLFINRAQAVEPSFVLRDADAAAVAEICARLDGLPLAIELAAARTKLLPPRALLRRLVRSQSEEGQRDSPLRLLAEQARDLPTRQRTLLSAIAWSYELLDAREQEVFRRLSVFVGGCSVEAAEIVAASGTEDGLQVIASLVDKSLIWREEQADGEPRLRMLETLRVYASEQLESSGEVDSVRARQAAYYVDLVEHASAHLVGPEQQTWFAYLTSEQDNLKTVERWAIARGDEDTLVRLLAALWPLWLARDDASQTRERLDTFLSILTRLSETPVLARALHGAAVLAEKQGDYRTCRALLEQSVILARHLDDHLLLATVLDSLGRQAFIEGRYADSRPLLEESRLILVQLDDTAGLARVLSHLGFLEFLEGRLSAARSIFEQGLELARAAEDQHRVAEFMDNLGNTFEAEGELDAASRMFQDAIAIWRMLELGPWLAMALNNHGKLLIRRGELGPARTHLLEALTLSYRMGNRRRAALTLGAVAALAAAEGDSELAARLNAIASVTIAEIGARAPAWRLTETPPVAAPGTFEQAVEDSLAWLARGAPQPQTHAVGLTRREREVVALLARGLTNRQIAEALVLTEGTVENYVQRILGKLNLNNRAQTAAWAVSHGFAIQPTK